MFQAKYRETVSATDKTINDSEALKISLFIEELFDKSDHLSKSGNLRLREAVQRVWALHEDGVICRYNIVFCSNDMGLSASARDILVSICSKHPQVNFECYGPSDLMRDLGSRDKSPSRNS